MIIKKSTIQHSDGTMLNKKFLIVGLGNPGMSYTRHNVGADMLNLLLYNYPFKTIEKNLFICKINNKFVLIYLTPSVMNNSGLNVKKIFNQYNCTDLIVVVDDLDTKIGKIKKSFGITDGGQKGVRSIIQHLKTNQFWKIKIGIDRPNNNEDISDYVLDKFNLDEKQNIFSIGPLLINFIHNILDIKE